MKQIKKQTIELEEDEYIITAENKYAKKIKITIDGKLCSNVVGIIYKL